MTRSSHGVMTLRSHTFMHRFDEQSVIFDLGGNRGEFAHEFSRRFPYRRIVVVEANPRLVAAATERLRNVRGVSVVHAAVVGRHEKGEVRFFLNPSNDEAGSIHRQLASVFHVSGNRTEESDGESRGDDGWLVKALTLAELRDRFEVGRVDLVKMDIEGAEWDVLTHFGQADFDAVGQMSVEFHDFIDPADRGRTRACVSRLRALGYRFIHHRIDYLAGSPYGDCLFYKPHPDRLARLGERMDAMRWTVGPGVHAVLGIGKRLVRRGLRLFGSSGGAAARRRQP